MNLKEVIISQREERDFLLSQDYVPREGVLSAKSSLNNNLIKVIVGPRRAGKSVFALQMLKDVNFAYLNFDDERLTNVSVPYLICQEAFGSRSLSFEPAGWPFHLH